MVWHQIMNFQMIKRRYLNNGVSKNCQINKDNGTKLPVLLPNILNNGLSIVVIKEWYFKKSNTNNNKASLFDFQIIGLKSTIVTWFKKSVFQNQNRMFEFPIPNHTNNSLLIINNKFVYWIFRITVVQTKLIFILILWILKSVFS